MNNSANSQKIANMVHITVNGDMTGAGALEKYGSGTLTLTQDNGYTGATTVMPEPATLGLPALGGLLALRRAKNR